MSDFVIENGVLEKYTGAGGDVVIPDGVTSIGDSAFSWRSSLTSITIPDSVTSIGNWAFNCCSSLTSITIPDGVTSIGNWAFDGCSSLTSITIPEGVTSIGSSAFRDCNSLTSITIPDGVTSIDSEAFSDCRNLTSITIPDSVTSIGRRAFYGCRSLTSVTIPDSVTSIGDEAFYGCSSLKNLTIFANIPDIGRYNAFKGCKGLADENGLIIVNDTVFGYYGSNESIVIPEGVTNIAAEAFLDNEIITSILLPKSIETVWFFAFKGCKKLQTIILQSNDIPFEYESLAQTKVLVIPEHRVSFDDTEKLKRHFDNGSNFPVKLMQDDTVVAGVVCSGENSGFVRADGYDWDEYDVMLAGNNFKTMRADSRFLAILYRLRWPIGLNEEIKQIYVEYAAKNYKKAIALAEQLDDPELIEALIANNCVEEKNRKTFNKLLLASSNNKIAALQIE